MLSYREVIKPSLHTTTPSSSLCVLCVLCAFVRFKGKNIKEEKCQQY